MTSYTPPPIDDDQLRRMMRDSRPSILDRYRDQAVTIVLIAINVVLFVVELAMTGASYGFSLYNLFSGGISTRVLLQMGAMYAPFITGPLDLWRLVAPMFLHMGVIHLLLNMVAFYSVGVTLERVLGHGSFLLLYLISGITGNAVSYAASMMFNLNTVSAGASTSVFGLFVAVVLLSVLCKGNRRVFTQYSKAMLSVIVINIIYTLIIPGISISGHLGGAVGGLIAMLCIPSKRLRVPYALRIVVAVLWVAVLVFLFASYGVFGL